VLARLNSRPAGLGQTLDWFVVHVAFPARIVVLALDLQLDAAAVVPVAVAWVLMAFLIVIVLVAARVAGWSKRTTGTLLLVVPFGNTAFLGFPMVELLLGVDHLGWAVLYDTLGSTLGLATVGTVLLGIYGGVAVGASSILRRVVTFPGLVALVVGLGLRLAPDLPAAIAAVLAGLGATLVPLAILSVGMRLSPPRQVAHVGPLATGLGLRLVVAPLTVLGVMALLGVSGSQWTTSAVQAGMSSGVVASIMAADAGLDAELAASLVGLGVFGAIVLAPLWVVLA